LDDKFYPEILTVPLSGASNNGGEGVDNFKSSSIFPDWNIQITFNWGSWAACPHIPNPWFTRGGHTLLLTPPETVMIDSSHQRYVLQQLSGT